MILVQRDDLPIGEFEDLLSKTRIYILNDLKSKNSEQIKAITAIEFETMVCEAMKKQAVGTDFEGKIYQTGLLTFPDIIAQDKLGVEVKVTAKDGWTSTGNSVLETTRKESVERIYMFFGKLGGVPDIKYKLYQDCLCEVVVTHSPRYLIDMDLDNRKSIFYKMNVDYDEFRKNDPIGKAKDFYRKQLKEGEDLWWIGVEDDKATKPLIIKNFNSLDRNTKDRFIAEAMVFFPEIFSSSSRDKFTRASAYLINKYNAVSSSLRDTFTAGGQETITVGSQEALVPKIFAELYRRSKAIKDVIVSADEDLLKEYWGKKEITDREGEWLEKLNSNAAVLPQSVTASDIYKNGLS